MCRHTRGHIFFYIRKIARWKIAIPRSPSDFCEDIVCFGNDSVAVNVALREGRYNFYNIFTNSPSTLYDMSRRLYTTM